MRLDKYLCSGSALSRTQAKRAISKGQVSVNGETVTNPASKIADSDRVQHQNTLLHLPGERYIMLHKPVNTICSNIDEHYPCVFNLLDIEKPQRLHVAGRLDADTTGLVLITDDGQWSHAITAPSKQCSKRYRVGLAEPVDESAVTRFADGIQLHHENKPTRPAQLAIVSTHEVLLTIHEGKYHQVKRMFAAIGNKVVKLHREAVGNIELDADLEPGEWRYLHDSEIRPEL